jgi:hypothetical protein
MKPEGRLAFACWQSLADNPWTALPLQAALTVLPPPPKPTPRAPGPFAFAEPDYVHEILSDAGWEDVDLTAHAVSMAWDGSAGYEATVRELVNTGPVGRLLAEVDKPTRQAVHAAAVPICFAITSMAAHWPCPARCGSSPQTTDNSMPTLGTPFANSATRVLLCGAGELGKEVVIALQRLGIEVIACDRYANAPAMQVADRSHVFSMLDGDQLREVIETRAAAFYRAGDRGHRHGHAGVPGRRRLQRRALGPRGASDHEPRGHPAPRGRDPGHPHLAVPLCRQSRDFEEAVNGDRPTLRGQADHELLGQGPEHGPRRRATCRRPGTMPRRAAAPAPDG